MILFQKTALNQEWIKWRQLIEEDKQ